MRKLRWMTLSFCVLMMFTAGAVSAADEWGEIVVPKDAPIKFGMGTVLSGPYANLGIDIKNGAEMALQEKGELLGHKLALEAGDDQCEGAPSVAIAEKFGNDPSIVAVMGYMCSSGSIAASDIHYKYKQLMVSVSATAPALTARGIPIVFRLAWNDNIQGKAAAEFALKNKWTKAALIHDKSTYGQGLCDVFKENFTKGGGTILAYEAITRGDKDFSPVLTKVKPLNPPVVNFGGMAAEGSLLIRQMGRSGFKSKFLAYEGCYTEKDFIQASGKAAVGSYVTYAKTPEGPVFQNWEKKFQAKYGPRQTYSPQGYDTATMLMKAVEKVAQKKDDGSLVIGKKALRDAVAATNFEGVTGLVKFDQYGDRMGSVIAVNQVVCQGEKCFFKELK